MTSDSIRIGWRTNVSARIDLSRPSFRNLLAERISAGVTEAALAAEFKDVNWDQLAKEGDVERGRALFGRDGVGCVKCHAVVPGQTGNGAPSLIDAATKHSPTHLGESIIFPSKVVDPAYRTVRIECLNGKTLTGLVVRQDAHDVILLLPDARQAIVAKKDIEEIRTSTTSPMPSGLVRTRQELADLLAYLRQVDRLPP
jgi:putative heme-binding domain-containing protein